MRALIIIVNDDITGGTILVNNLFDETVTETNNPFVKYKTYRRDYLEPIETEEIFEDVDLKRELIERGRHAARQKIKFGLFPIIPIHHYARSNC